MAGGTALAAAYVIVTIQQISRRGARNPLPQDAKFLRSPGESLQAKLVELDEHLLYAGAILFGGPFLYAFQARDMSTGTFLTFLLPLVGLCAVPLFVLARKRRNYALGYLGERAVGEQLNQLLRNGCHVFHDYVGGANWNIDHIVLAPSGVYAIETKARGKRRTTSGARDYEVTFDGQCLRFPNGFTDTKALEQARLSASSLARQLSSATGEPVKVTPIVTLPGWLVTLKGKADVHVLNPKQISQVVVDKARPKLAPEQVQRIAHQLELKCRTIDL